MNPKIEEIIAAIINETATESQKDILQEWLESDPLNEAIYNHIMEFLAAKYIDSEIINEEEIRDKIWQKAHEPGTGNIRKLFYSHITRIAAAVLILLVSTFAVYNLVDDGADRKLPKVFSVVEKSTLPGVKSTVHLPDGSKVVLNSSSKITFAEKFSDSVRWVKLIGEAFFEVAKNPGKPFIVQSKNILTKAIGTSFNVKTDVSGVDVSLVEGAVTVNKINSRSQEKNTLLNAGEYISYSGDKINSKGQFNIRDVTGWKDGLLIFKRANFETVVHTLENWYGVKITSTGSAPQWSMNGTYDNDNLENILKTLSHSQNFKYERIGNNVKIRFDERK